jgi:hypothetical protein
MTAQVDLLSRFRIIRLYLPYCCVSTGTDLLYLYDIDVGDGNDDDKVDDDDDDDEDDNNNNNNNNNEDS